MPDLSTTEQSQSGLTEEERIEYADLSNCARHDDIMIYQASSTMMPLSFGAIAAATQFPKMLLPLMVFSVVLYVYWLLLATRLSWYTSVRRIRQRELEQKAGLNHHRLLESPPEERMSQPGAKISIRRVRWWGLLVLIAAWITTLSTLRCPS